MRQAVPAPRRPVTTVEVVVVGAGPLGAAAAWQLARRVVAVLLLERFGPRHRTGPECDATRIYRPAGTDPVHIKLADEAVSLWRELETVTGASLLQLTGGIDHGDPGRVTELADRLGALGVPHSWLAAGEAARRWPGMAFEGPVLHQPGRSGRLNADHAVAALAAAATAHGAKVRHHSRVSAITVHGPSRIEVDIERRGGCAEVIRARHVVVAAGEWTAGLVDGLVPLPSLRTVRDGSAYFPVSDDLLPCGACSVKWPTFVHHGDDGVCQGLPVPGRGVKVSLDGATGTARDGSDRAALADHVSRWLPGADADRPTWTSREYTVSPDSAFVIERNGPVTVGTGVSRSAFATIPALGRLIADLTADPAMRATASAV
jgi:sarcosine oxidase